MLDREIKLSPRRLADAIYDLLEEEGHYVQRGVKFQMVNPLFGESYIRILWDSTDELKKD